MNNHKSVPIKYDHVTVESKNSDNLDKIGVICTTNCDNSKSGKQTAIVKTDVVVQVKSSVDISNKSKDVSEDIPDIPVVLGTKSAGSKNMYPNVDRGLQFHPVSRNFQGNNVPLTPINIETAFPALSQFVPNNLNEGQNTHTFNIKSAPGLVSLPDGYKYRTDGLEIKVPYFEPTYHKHYYGENSPPQYAFYPVRKAVRNPVAFNNIPRPTYSLSSWNQNYPRQNFRHPENCICQNQTVHGLAWYPVSSNQGQRPGRSNNIAVGIDDKLASVN